MVGTRWSDAIDSEMTAKARDLPKKILILEKDKCNDVETR